MTFISLIIVLISNWYEWITDPLILDTMILGTWQQLAAETDDLSISSDSDTVIEKTLNIYASPSFSIIRAEHICLNLLSLILKSFIIHYRVSFTITYNLWKRSPNRKWLGAETYDDDAFQVPVWSHAPILFASSKQMHEERNGSKLSYWPGPWTQSKRRRVPSSPPPLPSLTIENSNEFPDRRSDRPSMRCYWPIIIPISPKREVNIQSSVERISEREIGTRCRTGSSFN